MVVLVSTTITFTATVFITVRQPRVNAAKAMLASTARGPSVGLDVPMEDSVWPQMSVPVQMDLRGPDARQVGIKHTTTLINYLQNFGLFFSKAPPQLVATGEALFIVGGANNFVLDLAKKAL